MSKVVYLVSDLLFTSKIRETAKQIGLDAERAPSAETLAATAEGAQMVILDLRLPAALDALERLRADPRTQNIPAVGFIDHEQVERMELARQRGCAHVLAKGKFSSDLPSLLRAI